jgi:protoporphyrinogen oxidase
LYRFDQETGECGCQSMEQVSYSEFGSYQRPKGPDMEFPGGYSTLIRYLRSQIPQNWILFEQFVENIFWDSDDHVRITCANGKIYECDYVICTIPLAVMKWSYKSLFTPALPGKIKNFLTKKKIKISIKKFFSLEN